MTNVILGWSTKALLLGSLVVSVATLWRAYGQHETTVVLEPSLSPDETIGDQTDLIGPATAKFVLVEFADYQCPPCRASNKLISDLVNENAGKVRVAYRNFPQVGLHRHALAAAFGAEALRSSGHFLEMHERLMAGLVDRDAVAQNQRELAGRQINSGPEYDKAVKRVERDMAFAKREKVRGTPSYFLCSIAERKVFRLSSLSDLEYFGLKRPM